MSYTAYYHTRQPPSSRNGKRSSGSRTQSNYHQNVHQRSMFETTDCPRSFFIINPQWTSEHGGMHRMVAQERSTYAWHSRPSHHRPLQEFIIPLLEKRRQDDDWLENRIETLKSRQSMNGDGLRGGIGSGLARPKVSGGGPLNNGSRSGSRELGLGREMSRSRDAGHGQFNNRREDPPRRAESFYRVLSAMDKGGVKASCPAVY